ncbi:MAG: hypothetical protein JWO91_3648 [Acidobacteriaceae bacterium]|nr:hypothetical protein [Acidobacteriaceae bacterium]
MTRLEAGQQQDNAEADQKLFGQSLDRVAITNLEIEHYSSALYRAA